VLCDSAQQPKLKANNNLFHKSSQLACFGSDDLYFLFVCAGELESREFPNAHFVLGLVSWI
jgi:hypothetical protein